GSRKNPQFILPGTILCELTGVYCPYKGSKYNGEDNVWLNTVESKLISGDDIAVNPFLVQFESLQVERSLSAIRRKLYEKYKENDKAPRLLLDYSRFSTLASQIRVRGIPNNNDSPDAGSGI